VSRAAATLKHLSRNGTELLATYWMHAGPANPERERRWSPWSLESRLSALKTAGFCGIGLFHDDLAHVLRHEARGTTRSHRLEWVRDLLRGHGFIHVELECLNNWMLPKTDPRFLAEQPLRELLIQAASILGARHLKIGNFGVPVPIRSLRSAYRRLCEELRAGGTRVGFEIYRPDPNAQSLAQVLEWVSGHDNGGVFLDSWHVANMPQISHEDIAALDRRDLVGVELSDGLHLGSPPAAYEDSVGFPSFRVQTANMRRIPGEGDYDLAGFIRAVIACGFSGPWGNEILSEEYRRLPMNIAYPRVAEASRRLLQQAAVPRRVFG